MRKYTAKEDYPLYEHHYDDIRTATGKSLNDFTLEAIQKSEIQPEDCRISAEILERHAQIEESVGNFQIAAELRRSAEMTRIPDSRIMEIYNSLRPRMSEKKKLKEIAEELKTKYDAPQCAAFIEDAIHVYEKRNMFK